VQSLRKAGIRFAITSGRPPKGMAMLFDALKLDTPIAGLQRRTFRQGRTLSIIAQKDAAGRCRRQVDRADPQPTASMPGSIAAMTG